MVIIDFEINGFKDAIVLPDDHTMTETEIEAMKQQRYDNWYAIVNTVSEESEQE